MITRGHWLFAIPFARDAALLEEGLEPLEGSSRAPLDVPGRPKYARAPMNESPRSKAFAVLVAIIAVAASALGALCGALALALYSPGDFALVPRDAPGAPLALGPVLGAASSLGAGLLWGLAMLRLSARWRALPKTPFVRILGAGTGLGLAAGVAATLLLHAGLQLAAGQGSLHGFVIGLLFGAPAGVGLGVLSAAAWLALLGRLRARASEP